MLALGLPNLASVITSGISAPKPEEAPVFYDYPLGHVRGADYGALGSGELTKWQFVTKRRGRN